MDTYNCFFSALFSLDLCSVFIPCSITLIQLEFASQQITSKINGFNKHLFSQFYGSVARISGLGYASCIRMIEGNLFQV